MPKAPKMLGTALLMYEELLSCLRGVIVFPFLFHRLRMVGYLLPHVLVIFVSVFGVVGSHSIGCVRLYPSMVDVDVGTTRR